MFIFSWKRHLFHWLCALQVINILCSPHLAPLQGLVGGKRTLVLFDDLERAPNYSLFFDDLRDRGHTLSFLQAESSELQLKRYGENLYDNIVVFSPTAERFSSITAEDIVQFTEEGGNVLIAASLDASDNVRELAEYFGVKFDKKGTEVIDHFDFDKTNDGSLAHNRILAKTTINSRAILGTFVGKAEENPILFHGIGQSVAASNILAMKVLVGNPTTYAAMTEKDAAMSMTNAGSDTVLVSAVQGRNNARVVISGSLDMFSNAFFRSETNSGNADFCSELTKWGFGEMGVLRFRDITHTDADGLPPDVILHEKQRPDLPLSLYPDPELTRNSLVYRIKADIVYSMIVEELKDGIWTPFCADDMQMEFVMLDPYVRKTMVCDHSTGKFVTTFTAPDSYGVFKFRVLYRRTGYSVLHAETQVSIRPFKHDEYERFIFSAYPYYSSAISATLALFVFSILFLFSSDSK